MSPLSTWNPTWGLALPCFQCEMPPNGRPRGRDEGTRRAHDVAGADQTSRWAHRGGIQSGPPASNSHHMRRRARDALLAARKGCRKPGCQPGGRAGQREDSDRVAHPGLVLMSLVVEGRLLQRGRVLIYIYIYSAACGHHLVVSSVPTQASIFAFARSILLPPSS